MATGDVIDASFNAVGNVAFNSCDGTFLRVLTVTDRGTNENAGLTGEVSSADFIGEVTVLGFAVTAGVLVLGGDSLSESSSYGTRAPFLTGEA